MFHGLSYAAAAHANVSRLSWFVVGVMFALGHVVFIWFHLKKGNENNNNNNNNNSNNNNNIQIGKRQLHFIQLNFILFDLNKLAKGTTLKKNGNKIIKRKNRTKITKENKQKIKSEKEICHFSLSAPSYTCTFPRSQYSQDLHTPHVAGIINNNSWRWRSCAQVKIWFFFFHWKTVCYWRLILVREMIVSAVTTCHM